MGASVSWVVTRACSSDAVVDVLGLTRLPRSKTSESIDIYIAPCGDWLVLFFGRAEHPLLAAEYMKALSTRAEVVCGWAEEHVMASYAAGWAGGAETWCVLHDSEQGIHDLRATGKTPNEYEEVRRNRLEEQRLADEQEDDVDFVFNIPIDLVKALTGFSYEDFEEPDTIERLDWSGQAAADRKLREGIDAALRLAEKFHTRNESRNLPWYRRLFK